MNEQPEISQAMLQANPLLLVAMCIFVFVVLLVIAGFFSLWSTTLLRWYHGLPILSVDPWRPRAWGLIDVLLVLLAAFVGQMIMVPVWVKLAGLDLRKMFEDDRLSLSVMAVGSLSYLIAMLAGIFWLILRYGSSLEHMGLSLRRWWRNVGLGLAAAAMTLPIVAALSAAVNVGLKTEYDHPLINELKKEGTLSAYLLAVFSAVVVAPLVEEFFFRVLLQGWLQSVPWSRRSWWWLIGAGLDQSNQAVSDAVVAQVVEAPPVFDNPYAPPVVQAMPVTQVPPTVAGGATDSSFVLSQSELVGSGDSLSTSADSTLAGSTSAGSTTQPPPIWPSFVVGILFGLAHFDYGLSYIPLASWAPCWGCSTEPHIRSGLVSCYILP